MNFLALIDLCSGGGDDGGCENGGKSNRRSRREALLLGIAPLGSVAQGLRQEAELWKEEFAYYGKKWSRETKVGT